MSDATGDSDSIVALEADITARRERLAQTIDELSQKVTPKAIAKQQGQNAKARFAAATTTPEGDLRTERIAAVALAVVAVVGLVLFSRRRRG